MYGMVGHEQSTVPAQPAKKSANKRGKKALKWRTGDIDAVKTDFHEEFHHQISLSPYEYLKLFCDDNVFNNFVEQMQTVNTNTREMEQFLGIHVISGVLKLPSYKMYSSAATCFATVADVMTKNGFSKLRSQFHVNDNTNITSATDPSHDRLFKVHPFLTSILENLSKVEPEELNAVDEMIIPFKERCPMKQHIILK